MKALLLLLLLVLTPGTANAAGLYKCAKNGHSSYQDTPCDRASSQTQLQAGGTNPMIGCYVAKFPAWESAGTGSSEQFEIRAVTSGEYDLQFQEGKNIRLKRATPEELRDVSNGFHLHLSDGLSMKWLPDAPNKPYTDDARQSREQNRKPIGIYRGRLADGKNIIFVFFFISNGLATKVDCR